MAHGCISSPCTICFPSGDVVYPPLLKFGDLVEINHFGDQTIAIFLGCRNDGAYRFFAGGPILVLSPRNCVKVISSINKS